MPQRLIKAILMIIVFGSSASWSAVGGQIISEGAFRQTVALAFKSDNQNKKSEIYCSGTLIGPRVVLTVAHCFLLGAKSFKVSQSDFQNQTWIYIGDSPAEHEKPFVTTSLKAQRVWIYPQSDAMHSDVAVIELDRDVDLEAYGIRPAPLTVPDQSFLGHELYHVGYGMIENNGLKGSKTIFNLPLRSLTGHSGLSIGEPFMEGPSACHGDSGGSAYLKNNNGEWLFVGIEQSISNHPCGKSATYFIPLSATLLSWIKQNPFVLFESSISPRGDEPQSSPHGR